MSEYDITAYADGACRGNPGIGGWGVRIESAKAGVREFSGGARETTNNRMELSAAINALCNCPFESKILLVTDSEYVKNGITKWINNWKKNGWKTAKKEPVKNADLWKLLDELCGDHNVTWQWVRGHNGHTGNERADQLANIGIERLIRGA